MNKVAIYCRISTNSQTLYNQKMVLAEYAHKRNWEFDIYEEIESTKNTRPVKYSLMEQIRLGVKYDAVIVQWFDRWARDYHELICDLKELTKYNIQFISVGDRINISTKTGKEALRLLMAFYKFELSKISERTKLGLLRAKEEGKLTGRPKGAKDRAKRKTAGYFEREARKRIETQKK